MSIKGKIEAIIYAAEEPVTIDQIAALLRNDVLAAMEEQQRAAADTIAAAAEAGPESVAEPRAEVSPVELADNADVPPESVDVPATGSEEPSEAREHPERAPDFPDEATESSEPAADGEPTQARNIEEPSESGAGITKAPETDDEAKAEAEKQTAGEEQTSAPEQAAANAEEERPSEAEPARADASTAAPTPVAKKRKPSDPEMPRIRQFLRRTVEEMIATYASEDRGIEIKAIAGGFRMATKPEHHDLARAFAKSLKPAIKLSLQALETLAVIAYKQPVTVPEISEIRGVDSSGVIATLLDRKLITTAGRKAVIGRPMLYKTTKEFLLRFGLNEVGELPSMEEFEKLAQEQTDLFDKDAAPENAPVPPPDEPTFEDMDGDSSDGADTAESVVRVQIGEDSGVAEEPMPADAGDRSDGADTAESVVRDQVEGEQKQD